MLRKRYWLQRAVNALFWAQRSVDNWKSSPITHFEIVPSWTIPRPTHYSLHLCVAASVSVSLCVYGKWEEWEEPHFDVYRSILFTPIMNKGCRHLAKKSDEDDGETIKSCPSWRCLTHSRLSLPVECQRNRSRRRTHPLTHTRRHWQTDCLSVFLCSPYWATPGMFVRGVHSYRMRSSVIEGILKSSYVEAQLARHQAERKRASTGTDTPTA